MSQAGRPRARARAPLEGLRVLSLAEQYPGPYATLVLSDLGADVVLVERPQGDPSRRDPAFFDALNRNKRSAAFDLKDANAREAVLALARRADVMLEGFRPGTAERLGIGPAAVRKANPRIVYASISGFGQSGPYRDVPAHDLSYQAMAGLLHRQLGVPRPEMPWLSIGNLAGGLFAALGVLAALHARGARGRGSFIDVALLDGLISLMTVHLAPVLDRTGPRDAAPEPGYGLYRTADKKLLSLSIWGEDHFWTALCDLTGLTRHRSLSFAARVERHDALARSLSRAFARRPLRDWTRLLTRAHIPFAPVLDLPEVAKHPQVTARGLIAALPSGSVKRRAVRQPLVFDGHAPGPTRRAPELGEHTREVLAEAGYSRGRIERLVRSGAAIAG